MYFLKFIVSDKTKIASNFHLACNLHGRTVSLLSKMRLIFTAYPAASFGNI